MNEQTNPEVLPDDEPVSDTNVVGQQVSDDPPAHELVSDTGFDI